VGVHEYIHMAQLTKVSGEPSIIRALFGNIFYPNMYQPNWMSEAITVYGESAMSPYSGRMNGGTYPAIISALSAEGKMPSLTKAGYYSSGTPLANHYVFGGSFYKYLADTYGQDKFATLFEYSGSSLFSYLNPLYSNLSLDLAYQEAYGKPLQMLWSEWQAWERSKAYSFPREAITRQGWNISNLRYHDGSLYYLSYIADKTGPFSRFGSNRLMRLRDPEGLAIEEVLVEQATEFPAGYQLVGKQLYYSRQEMSGGYDNNEFDGLGVISEIWQKDLNSGHSHKLTSGQIRSFMVRQDGSLLLSEDDRTHQNSLLFRFDSTSGLKQEIARLNYLVGTMHEADGRLFVTARGFYKNNSIYELRIDEGKLIPLIDTPFSETIVDVAGGKIIYDAVYEGKNGSYTYDIASRSISRVGDYTEVSSLAVGSGGETYFISMNSRGQDIYKDQLRSRAFQLPATEKKPPYQRLEAGKNDLVLGKYPPQKGGYLANIGHMLWPRMYRFPILGGSQDSLQVGIQMAGSDLLGDFPFWAAALLWDSSTKSLGYQVQLENNLFRPIKQTLSYSSFNGSSLSASQQIQLYNKMNYGLTGVWTGFGIITSEGLDRKLWYPFLGTSFNWRGGALSATNQIMYETTRFWASDRDRLGWQARGTLRQKLSRASELRSRVQVAWDPDAPLDEVFSGIRGYDSDWLQTKGVTVQNSLYTPLIKIREGIWNPNIYLEDISAGLFFDTAVPSNRDETQIRWSTGAELIAELHAGYMFSLDLGVRLSYNKDGLILPSLILGTEF